MDFVSGVLVLDEVILRDKVYEMRFNKREKFKNAVKTLR